MRVREDDPGLPVEPPRQDQGHAEPPTEEELEARRRQAWERRKVRARGLADKFPGRFEYREGEYPSDGVLIGHNPMAPEYDHLREPDGDT